MITEYTRRPAPATCTREATRRAIALLVAAGMVAADQTAEPTPASPFPPVRNRSQR